MSKLCQNFVKNYIAVTILILLAFIINYLYKNKVVSLGIAIIVTAIFFTNGIGSNNINNNNINNNNNNNINNNNNFLKHISSSYKHVPDSGGFCIGPLCIGGTYRLKNNNNNNNNTNTQ